MRMVMVSKYVRQDDNKLHLTPIGEGRFHTFGVNYEEFETGPGNFSTAIVEMADGSVLNVPVEHIKFLDV